jgi:hypothetical protein
MYRGQLNGRVTIRRPGTPPTDVSDIQASIRDYSPEELVGGIYQGTSQIVVMTEDVTLTPTVRIGDTILDEGKPRRIGGVKRRRVGTETIAYQLDVKG